MKELKFDKKQNLCYRVRRTILPQSKVDGVSKNTTKNSPLFKKGFAWPQRWARITVSKNSAEGCEGCEGGEGWIGEPSEDLESAGQRPSQARHTTLFDTTLREALTPAASSVILNSASARSCLSMHGTLTWRRLSRLDLHRISLQDAIILLGNVSSLTESLLELAKSATANTNGG